MPKGIASSSLAHSAKTQKKVGVAEKQENGFYGYM